MMTTTQAARQLAAGDQDLSFTTRTGNELKESYSSSTMLSLKLFTKPTSCSYYHENLYVELLTNAPRLLFSRARLEKSSRRAAATFQNLYVQT